MVLDSVHGHRLLRMLLQMHPDQLLQAENKLPKGCETHESKELIRSKNETWSEFSWEA